MILGFGVTLGAAILAEALGLDREPGHHYGGFSRASGHNLGMRGPTSAFRYPMPRVWERMPPDLGASAIPAKPHTRFAGGRPSCGDSRFGALCSNDVKDHGISGPCGCVVPPELLPPNLAAKFGYNTSGIRGMSPRAFTRAQIAAYNRDGAAQGLRPSSVAPPA